MTLAALLLAASVWAGEPAKAPRPAPRTPPLPGNPVELKTVDGWTLQAKHAPAPEGGKTILFLHGAGGRKEEWRRLVNAAGKRGYGAFAVDFRGHGESRKAPDGTPADWRKFPKPNKQYNEWANMLVDVQAAVDWLTANGVLEETIIIVGDHVGGILGIKHAAVHPKIPMMAMVGPQIQYNDVTVVNAVRAYKDRPILFVYSEQDKNAARSMPILFTFAKNAAGERKTSQLMVKKDRGPRMLRGPALEEFLAWLDDPIKPEPLPEEVQVSTAVSPVEQGAEEPEEAAVP